MSYGALAAHSAETPDDAVLREIERARASGNLPAASAILAGALDLVRAGTVVGDVLADEFFALAIGWSQANPQQQLNALRVGCALNPVHAGLRAELDKWLARHGGRAKLTDYTQDIGEDELALKLFVTCFVKSGSTYLSNLLIDLTGWLRQHLSYAYMENEQEIHLPYLLSGARENSVIQQHARATTANLHLLQAFGIRPIVQVRDVFDCLLSYKEFLGKGAYADTFYQHFPELDDHAQMDLVIADRAAWYMSFYAGWYRAMRDGQIDGLLVRYEDLVGDPVGTLQQVAGFHGLSWEDERIKEATVRVASDRSSQRFNRGVSGRGHQAFSTEQQAHVERLARCHPDVDFGPIGL